MHIKDATLIVPKSELASHINGISANKIYDALPSKDESEAYAMVFKTETKVCIFIFKVTRDTLKALHYYNKNTVMIAL